MHAVYTILFKKLNNVISHITILFQHCLPCCNFTVLSRILKKKTPKTQQNREIEISIRFIPQFWYLTKPYNTSTGTFLTVNPKAHSFYPNLKLTLAYISILLFLNSPCIYWELIFSTTKKMTSITSRPAVV